MRDTTTVEVERTAHEAAMDAIETAPRALRPAMKDFASQALIEKAKRFCKPRRGERATKASKP